MALIYNNTVKNINNQSWCKIIHCYGVSLWIENHFKFAQVYYSVYQQRWNEITKSLFWNWDIFDQYTVDKNIMENPIFILIDINLSVCTDWAPTNGWPIKVNIIFSSCYNVALKNSVIFIQWCIVLQVENHF